MNITITRTQNETNTDTKNAPSASSVAIQEAAPTVEETLWLAVEEAGLARASGRIYITQATLDAIAKVQQDGTPVVIAVPGRQNKAYHSHQAVWRTGEGAVAVQNVSKAKAPKNA